MLRLGTFATKVKGDGDDCLPTGRSIVLPNVKSFGEIFSFLMPDTVSTFSKCILCHVVTDTK